MRNKLDTGLRMGQPKGSRRFFTLSLGGLFFASNPNNLYFFIYKHINKIIWN
jgi:hypothetical protein